MSAVGWGPGAQAPFGDPDPCEFCGTRPASNERGWQPGEAVAHFRSGHAANVLHARFGATA